MFGIVSETSYFQSTSHLYTLMPLPERHDSDTLFPYLGKKYYLE